MLQQVAPRKAAACSPLGFNPSLPLAEQESVTETQRCAHAHGHGVRTVAWPGALPFRWLWNSILAPWPPQGVGRQRSLDRFKVVGTKADSRGRDLPGCVRLPQSHAGLCSPGGEVLSPHPPQMPHCPSRPPGARPVLLTPRQLSHEAGALMVPQITVRLRSEGPCPTGDGEMGQVCHLCDSGQVTGRPWFLHL